MANFRQKLFAAAWRGEVDSVRDLLATNGESANLDACDENGVVALRFAAQFGHKEVARILLDAGASVDVVAHDGLTPLLAAVEKGEKEVCGMGKVPDLFAHLF